VATPVESPVDFIPPPEAPAAVRRKSRHNVPTGLWIVAIVSALVSLGAIAAIIALTMR
jgi:hypothetical protein